MLPQIQKAPLSKMAKIPQKFNTPFKFCVNTRFGVGFPHRELV